MNLCPENKERLLDFVVGALDPMEARALEEHLKGCSDCSHIYRDLTARREKLDAALGRIGTADPSSGFHRRIMARIERAPSTPHRARVFLGSALATAALLCLVLLSSRAWLPRWSSSEADELGGIRSLVGWQSPTAPLLRSPADGLLRSTPPLVNVESSPQPVDIKEEEESSHDS